jgi:hypothetical protein
MQTKKLFLASSSELKGDRDQFEIFIGRKNQEWVGKGVFLKPVIWENFLDAMSQTRLQDEYNKAIGECDIFVMLFWTKVGKYTEEEFEHAFKQFQATNKPFIFSYFKGCGDQHCQRQPKRPHESVGVPGQAQGAGALPDGLQEHRRPAAAFRSATGQARSKWLHRIQAGEE